MSLALKSDTQSDGQNNVAIGNVCKVQPPKSLVEHPLDDLNMKNQYTLTTFYRPLNLLKINFLKNNTLSN